MLWRFSKARTWVLTSDCVAVLKHKQGGKSLKSAQRDVAVNTCCHDNKIIFHLPWLIRYNAKIFMFRMLKNKTFLHLTYSLCEPTCRI